MPQVVFLPDEAGVLDPGNYDIILNPGPGRLGVTKCPELRLKWKVWNGKHRAINTKEEAVTQISPPYTGSIIF